MCARLKLVEFGQPDPRGSRDAYAALQLPNDGDTLKLKVGQSLASAVDATVIIVVRALSGDFDLCCGGTPMKVPNSDPAEPTRSPSPDLQNGTLLGKRYVDATGSVELLCTKPGSGTLTINGEQLQVKVAKPLPASD
jgi:hypothetical protein